jgi:hypothetical protein
MSDQCAGVRRICAWVLIYVRPTRSHDIQYDVSPLTVWSRSGTQCASLPVNVFLELTK